MRKCTDVIIPQVTGTGAAGQLHRNAMPGGAGLY